MKHCPKCQQNWMVDGNQKCPYCNCGLMAGSSTSRGSLAVESWEIFVRNSVNEIAKLVVSNQQQDEPTTCERCILNLCHGVLEKQKPPNHQPKEQNETNDHAVPETATQAGNG